MVIWESIQNRVIDLNQFRADVLEFIKFHWVKKKKKKKFKKKKKWFTEQLFLIFKIE